MSDVDRNFTFKLDADKKYTIDDAGFLRAKATVTRAGIFTYNDERGHVRELRSPEEVFSKKSLDTLKMIPITQQHPSSKKVDVNNVRYVNVGTTGENITQNGNFVMAPIVITDKDSIKSILDNHKNGIDTELSCGYKTKVDNNMKGVHSFGEYDAIQSKIRYNHVSIVPQGGMGRAGGSVKIHLDHKKGGKKVKFQKNAIKMDSFNMDEINEEINDENNNLINKICKKLDEAVEVIGNLLIGDKESKKKIDEFQAKIDQALEENKKLKEDVAELSNPESDRVKAMAAERNDIFEIAKLIEVKTDGKDIKTLKIDIIKGSSPNFDSKDKTDDYINARYDGIREMIKNVKTDSSGLGTFRKTALDNIGNTEDKIDHRDKFIKNSKVWETPDNK